MEQRCGNCEYYDARYCECEHPEQTQREADYKIATDGAHCELWESGGEVEEGR